MTVEDDEELLEILTHSNRVASVGVSSNPEKPSYDIFGYLQEHGYEMIPVNPTAQEILGRQVYADSPRFLAKSTWCRYSASLDVAARGAAGDPSGRKGDLDAGRHRQRGGCPRGRSSRAAGGHEPLHAQDPHPPGWAAGVRRRKSR